MIIGDEEYYNWHNDGGCIIRMRGETTFELYEVPIFGGQEQYIDEFTTLELAKQFADKLT